MTGKQLKNSILQWAIQGKLVPQDPNDEPASVLLEKIRAEKAQLVKEGKLKKKDLEVKPIAEDEIPFEIPKNWEWVRFGTITVNRDSERIPLSVAERSRLEKKYDYYGASGVIDKVDKYLFNKPLLLIGEDGANLINRSTPIAFIARGEYWVNNHAHVLDYLNQDLMQYICLYINAISLVDYVTGTAQPKMNQENMNSIPVALPPLAEQCRILAKIEELMPLVEKYGAAQEALNEWNQALPEKLKKSILQEAIQGKLVPQDPADEPASVLLERIREEKKRLVKEGKLKKKDLEVNPIEEDEVPFEIPESWEWCRLNDVCTITNGFTPLRTEPLFWVNGTINWFTVEDIREQGEIINYTKQKITEAATTKERIVRAGSVLLCCTASVGQCAFVKIPVTTNQQFNALTVKPHYEALLSDDYLFLFAKTLRDELHRLAGKTTFEFISVKKVGNILVPIPPLAEQRRIVEKTEELFGVIKK